MAVFRYFSATEAPVGSAHSTTRMADRAEKLRDRSIGRYDRVDE